MTLHPRQWLALGSKNSLGLHVINRCLLCQTVCKFSSTAFEDEVTRLATFFRASGCVGLLSRSDLQMPMLVMQVGHVRMLMRERMMLVNMTVCTFGHRIMHVRVMAVVMCMRVLMRYRFM